MPSFTMLIYAIFDGDTPLDAIRITIESTKTISHLKKLIVSEHSHALSKRGIDAHSLSLWRVSILIPSTHAGHPREPAWYGINDNVQLLEPNQKVGDVFTVELVGTKVQVLIQQASG